MADVEYQIISWEQIKKVWETKLWPGRKSAIEPISAIQYADNGSAPVIDMTILEIDQKPHFVGGFDGDKLIAVNSGFKTGPNLYRSRGLYIDPEYRGRGIAAVLLREMAIEALFLDIRTLWSMPRQSAFKAYERLGFIQTSEWMDKGVEFGPNCYAALDVHNNQWIRSILPQ